MTSLLNIGVEEKECVPGLCTSGSRNILVGRNFLNHINDVAKENINIKKISFTRSETE